MTDQRTFSDSDFGEHYRNRYGRTGRPYEDYQPAYQYGWEMARDPRHAGRDWPALDQDARHDWERRYPQQRWEEMRDAVAEGFSRGRGVRRSNFGAMEGDPGVNQVSSGLRSGGTGDVTHEPQGEGTFPAPSRTAASNPEKRRERGRSRSND